MEKPCRKYALKASSRPLFYFGKHPKQLLHARNSFKNRIFGKGIIKNLLKSQLYFFFRTQSLLMDKVTENKRGLELVTTRSSGHKTSSEKFLYSLYII